MPDGAAPVAPELPPVAGAALEALDPEAAAASVRSSDARAAAASSPPTAPCVRSAACRVHDRADGRIPARSADDCAPQLPGFAEREIPVDRVWAPDSDGPGSYDDRIEAAGLLHGPDKRAAAERLLTLDRFDPRWPVSIVHEHPDAQLLLAP